MLGLKKDDPEDDTRRNADGSQFLLKEDFRPFLDVVLSEHPGLEFLQGTKEFQMKY